MQTITLPIQPENYFGTQPAVTNLNVGDVLYIGSRHNLEEMQILSLARENDNIIISTDKATLIASNLTRVNRKGF